MLGERSSKQVGMTQQNISPSPISPDLSTIHHQRFLPSLLSDILYSTMAEDQKRLQSLSDSYQKLQTGPPFPSRFPQFPPTDLRSRDLQATISARQKLESQQQENKGVQTVLPPHPLSPLPYTLFPPPTPLPPNHALTDSSRSGILHPTTRSEHLQASRPSATEAGKKRGRAGRGGEVRIYREGDVGLPTLPTTPRGGIRGWEV